jgi:hypothetical protein
VVSLPCYAVKRNKNAKSNKKERDHDADDGVFSSDFHRN